MNSSNNLTIEERELNRKINIILSDMALEVSKYTEYWVKKNGILGEFDTADFTSKPSQQLLNLIQEEKEKVLDDVCELINGQLVLLRETRNGDLIEVIRLQPLTEELQALKQGEKNG